MPHQRQLIRQATKTALVNAATAAGSRVYETRILPFRRTTLPALAVYTLVESVDEADKGAPRELVRNLQLAIEGSVEAGENVDDELDSLALQVETAMHADDSLGGTAEDAVLESTEVTVVEDGSKPVGVVRLVYAVTYRTYAPASVAAPDDFNTVDARFSLAGEQAPADQAHDTFTVQE